MSSLAWIDFDEDGEQFRFDLRGLVLRLLGKQPAQTGDKGRPAELPGGEGFVPNAQFLPLPLRPEHTRVGRRPGIAIASESTLRAKTVSASQSMRRLTLGILKIRRSREP